MKDAKKLNNLLGIEEMSADKVLGKKAKPTKRTEVAKDVLQENAYVLGKDVLGGKLPNKEFHAAKGLNNLISLEDFTKSVPNTSAKPTKRTEVAKDVIKENAYVLGKDVLGGKLPNKEDHIKPGKGLNNLICIDDFTKNSPATASKATKRTETGKDVLLEKKKKEVCKKDDCDDDDDLKGLTAKQKKLPLAFQKSILKRQGKK
jgi:hypothetical protein